MATVLTTGFGVTLRADSLLAALEAAPGRLHSEMKRAMVEMGGEFAKRHKTKQFGAYRWDSYRSRLRNRSGFMRNRTKFIVNGSSLNSLRLVMFNDDPAAKPQELGGTMRPTGASGSKGRYLSIPTKAALTPSGNLRGQMQIVKDANGYRTNAGLKTFVIEKNSKKYVAIRTNAKKSKVIAIRRLKPVVFLPGTRTFDRSRLGFKRTWDHMAGFKVAALLRAAERTLAAITKGAKS